MEEIKTNVSLSTPDSQVSPPVPGDAPKSPEEIRRALLKPEAAIRLIGLLSFMISFFLLIDGVYIFSLVLHFIYYQGSYLDELVFSGIAAFCLSGAVLYIFVGRGLRNLENWARISSGILAVPVLFAFPFGTLVSVITLFLLFSMNTASVCNQEYRQVLQATPNIRYQAPPDVNFAVVFLLIILALFLVFKTFSAFQDWPRVP